jgi:hypothetical protein
MGCRLPCRSASRSISGSTDSVLGSCFFLESLTHGLRRCFELEHRLRRRMRSPKDSSCNLLLNRFQPTKML